MNVLQEKFPTEWDHNSSHWNNAVHEDVPYKEDFPQCFLTLPEATDNSCQSGATKISIDFHIPSKTEPKGSLKGTPWKLAITDDGSGILTLPRLLKWASNDATSIHNRYGHGAKKMLTKWMRDYTFAKWTLSYRTMNKRGLSNDLIVVSAPFLGEKTPKTETEDTESLMPSGTRWELEFDPSILEVYSDSVDLLYKAVQEILCTR